ncbi:SBBP repeat-containing protein, partial [Candidatus Gottesmanbacteria bacterium]|nr:SBBP repeat-containing protein [Candidatus Gottesmanbacteria bacterium]
MKKIGILTVLVVTVVFILLSTPNSFAQVSPTVTFSSYFGGQSTIGGFGYDTIRDVYIDNSGNIYITGGTDSNSGFPITAGSYDTAFNSDSCPTIGTAGALDIFVAKLTSTGQLIWSTYLGGPCYDRAYAIEVDETTGEVYVAGRAGDSFPTTAGVIQPNFNNDSNPNTLYGQQDGIIAKISADGSQLLWATYFGGGDRSFIRDMDIDTAGNVYVVETNVSQNNPHITAGAFDDTLTPIVDGGVIAKINSAATAVDWATYFGGGGVGTYDLGTPSIRVDNLGNVYATGQTSSSNVPSTGGFDTTLNGTTDMHLVKFSGTGNFLWGTYIGGDQGDGTETHGLALDPSGNPIVAATTLSTDLNTSSPYSTVFNSGFQSSYGGTGGPATGANSNYPGDGFIVKVSSAGNQLLAGTYLGGSVGEGIEGVYTDTLGNVYVSGVTYSSNFPTSIDGYDLSLNGNADYFGVKLNDTLNQLIYGTYVGGLNQDFARTSMFNNNLFVIGGEIQSDQASSPPWPLVNALDSTYAGNTEAALVIVDFSGVSTTPPPTSTPTTAPTITNFYSLPGDGRMDYFGALNSGCGLTQWDTAHSSLTG